MKLRERIQEIGIRRINPDFVAYVNLPCLVDALCKQAFVERWEYESKEGLRDCANIRKAARLFDSDTFKDSPDVQEVAQHELV